MNDLLLYYTLCNKGQQTNKITLSNNVPTRVETSTDFATGVPDIHYPTGTQVLVTVNFVSD